MGLLQNRLTWGYGFRVCRQRFDRMWLWRRVTVRLTVISRFCCRRICAGGCRRGIAVWLVIEAVRRLDTVGVACAAAYGRGGCGGL